MRWEGRSLWYGDDKQRPPRSEGTSQATCEYPPREGCDWCEAGRASPGTLLSTQEAGSWGAPCSEEQLSSLALHFPWMAFPQMGTPRGTLWVLSHQAAGTHGLLRGAGVRGWWGGATKNNQQSSPEETIYVGKDGECSPGMIISGPRGDRVTLEHECWVPRRRKRQATPVCLPGKSHGQRSLVDYSPWRHKSWVSTWVLRGCWRHREVRAPLGAAWKGSRETEGWREGWLSWAPLERWKDLCTQTQSGIAHNLRSGCSPKPTHRPQGPRLWTLVLAKKGLISVSNASFKVTTYRLQLDLLTTVAGRGLGNCNLGHPALISSS